MTNRIGDWMQTATGKKFWPMDPREEEVCMEDIAHALSMICRYGGHTKVHYSVAQHSVLVSKWLEEQGESVLIQREGLMHDALEAYVNDMITPLKRYLPQFRELEDKVDAVIRRKFGLPIPVSPQVKHADMVILATEKRDVMLHDVQWSIDIPEPWKHVIKPAGSPQHARSMFEYRLQVLGMTQ